MKLEIRQMEMPQDKYALKCPYKIKPKFVVIHNTANDASAVNEIRYMQSNDNEVSFHLAVDDKEAVQGVPFDRNAWHAGEGGLVNGNKYGIAIEICYSESGGDRFIKAERNAAELTAHILRANGWGIDAVRKHQDFSGKYCPHRTLDLGWDRFVSMVREYLETDADYADLVCEKCGFEAQTREYLDAYKYAPDLWRKLWFAMKGE